MTDEQLSNTVSPYQQGVFLIINKQMIPLTKTVTTLGRQIGNDIVFQEEFLSRFHAEILQENDKYVLVDKDSTSGTFVNGRKIDRCVLNSGDLIALAEVHNNGLEYNIGYLVGVAFVFLLLGIFGGRRR